HLCGDLGAEHQPDHRLVLSPRGYARLVQLADDLELFVDGLDEGLEGLRSREGAAVDEYERGPLDAERIGDLSIVDDGLVVFVLVHRGEDVVRAGAPFDRDRLDPSVAEVTEIARELVEVAEERLAPGRLEDGDRDARG